MINWDKLAYSPEEFKSAWEQARFVNDAALALSVNPTTGKLKTLQRQAESLGLETKPIWNKTYTVEEFTQAWNESLTMQEVAQKLGTTTRGFETLRATLGLAEKASATPTTYSQEEFINAWNAATYIDDVAQLLDLPTSKQGLGQIAKIARSLNLPPKAKEVPTTDTGEDASAIIATWIDWHRDNFQVTPLTKDIGALSRSVKQLIKAGYSAQSIKYGLWQWSLKSQTEAFTHPALVESKTKEFHLRNNAQVAETVQTLQELADSEDRAAIAQPSNKLQIERQKW